ncbi:hypothetical protein DFH06DRAFT_540109 [Mycena polygramma]|nr:hypothetical protein DFH06DRAFT_540109 [Mycena polygramma]
MSETESQTLFDKPIGSHLDHEHFWIDHQRLLLSRGYLLRPRYHPGWVPPWTQDGARSAVEYEESRQETRQNVLDAIRVADGSKVVLKRVRTWTSEISLGRYFNSEEVLNDPHNRTYRLLDIIPLPDDDDFALIAMPFLRRFDSPIFQSLEEVTEAMLQFLQGLEFMHRHNVAHRDACSLNLMMDCTNVLPLGFHFSAPWTHDGVVFGVPWRRRSLFSPVGYFFIDFGLADYWPEGPQQTRAVGVFGQDKTVPELSDTVPYNPFKVDIYQLGNVFTALNRKYPAMARRFEPLASSMTQLNPDDRPTAPEALAAFESIYSSISHDELVQRLYLRSPSPDGSSVSGDSDSDFELNTDSGSEDEGLPERDSQDAHEDISNEMRNLNVSEE